MSPELRQRVRLRSDDASSTTTSSNVNGETAGTTSAVMEHNTKSDGITATQIHSPNHNGLLLGGARRRHWIKYLAVFVHVVAVLIVSSGFLLRMSFHSGVECEMTYSMRHFLCLQQDNNSSSSSESVLVPQHAVYRLFKFTDLRDPRQADLHGQDTVDTRQEWSTLRVKQTPPSSNNETRRTASAAVQYWCTTPTNANTTIVLFIPGHWGSFSQARSLGAHGLQWTRKGHGATQTRHQQRLLETSRWNGRAPSIDDFVYDVYAVDFGEQGGALHANFLYAQSDYVANVVSCLVNACGNPNIILVGHSMGGLVARAVPLLYPAARPHISNLVTLATPHSGLPYAFDESIAQFYKLFSDENDDHDHDDASSEHHNAHPAPPSLLTTVSISGGLRDEMIPPKVCQMTGDNSNNNVTLSVLASDLLPKAPSSSSLSQTGLGMDHRAIVWCHNVLAKVRQVLHVMAAMESDSEEKQRRLEAILPAKDYAAALTEERKAFQHQYGFWASTAMESAMLYRIELLLGLYTMTAGIRHAFPWLPLQVLPAIVSGLAWWWSSSVDNAVVVLILSVVANAVHWVVSWSMARTLLLSRTVQNNYAQVARRHAVLFLVLFSLVQIAAVLFGYRRNRSMAPLSCLPAVFVTAVLFVPIIASVSSTAFVEPSETTFRALLLPVWPFLVVGKLFMIAWNVVWEFPGNSMNDLSVFLLLVCFPVYLRSVLLPFRSNERSSTHRWMTSSLYLLALVSFASHILGVGGGYVVGHFLASVAWIDVLFAVPALLTA